MAVHPQAADTFSREIAGLRRRSKGSRSPCGGSPGGSLDGGRMQAGWAPGRKSGQSHRSRSPGTRLDEGWPGAARFAA